MYRISIIYYIILWKKQKINKKMNLSGKSKREKINKREL